MYTMWSNMITSFKSKIIKERSNIFKIESVVSTKTLPWTTRKIINKLNYLLNRFYVLNRVASKMCIDDIINRTSHCTVLLPYRYDVGTLGNERVFFTKPLSKSNSWELLMFGIVLARYSASPHNIRNSRPLWTFLWVVHLKYRIIDHLKLKFHEEGIYKYICLWNFHILKY